MTLESTLVEGGRVQIPFDDMVWISDLLPTPESKTKFWKENQSHIIKGGLTLSDVRVGDWYLYRSQRTNQKFLLNVIYTDSKGHWIVVRDNWKSGTTLFSTRSSSINALKFVIFTNMSTLELKGANFTAYMGDTHPPISHKSEKYWNASSWGPRDKGEYIKIDQPITRFINWTQHPFDEVKE